MGKDEWLTPKAVIDELGPFDLDPCAPIVRPWEMASQHFTIEDDGLSKAWHGFVWCNPPYGDETWKWLDRMHRHGNGIALIFARTETEGFSREVWGKADAILFKRGRFHFHHVDGTRAAANAGAPSCFVAYGERAVVALEWGGIPGALVKNWRNDAAVR